MTTYRVKRGHSPAGPFTVIADDLLGRIFIDTSAENGIGYWYIVCAVNAAGAETCSASIYTV
ncbi:MAG: hypothetical protein ACRD9R_03940, partial [Pyrinomonadaceae bacterium]